MSVRRATVGLALLSALVLCAFTAPHAMAINGTWAFKCIHTIPSGEEFSDEHCKSAQTGQSGFTEMVITANTETAITTTNSSTEGKVVNPKLKGTIAGVGFELEASSFMSCEGKTVIENKFNGSEQPEATGTFCGEFTSVVVKKPEKCEIEKGVVKLLENGTGRTVVNTSEEHEMYVQLIPPAGKPFSEFTFAGGSCPLKGAKVSVTGSVTANFSTVLSQNDGATLTFTTSQTGKTLKAGGNKAEFEGTFTSRGVSTEEPPIALTTTNP